MSNKIEVLEPSGILDSVTGNKVRNDVADLILAGVDIVLIDFKNITFMDSSGLGAMVATLQKVRTAGCKLYLCSLNDQLTMLLDLTKMLQVFEIFEIVRHLMQRSLPILNLKLLYGV
ncbi:MAG: STAS domain-containing protein [Pseudanabaena sp. SU_2_4]|nr:STAS domain-containing protein [Pseudanabaena sp. SU_2_4]